MWGILTPDTPISYLEAPIKDHMSETEAQYKNIFVQNTNSQTLIPLFYCWPFFHSTSSTGRLKLTEIILREIAFDK